MVTAGLDLRWMTSPRHPTPKGSHIIKQTNWQSSCCASPLGTRAYIRVLYSAGQDLRFFLRFATKAAKPSDAHVTPLGSYCRASLCQQIYYPHFFSHILIIELQREAVVLALEVVVEEPLVDDDVVVEGFDDKGVGAHTDILRQFADGLTTQHLRLPAF